VSHPLYRSRGAPLAAMETLGAPIAPKTAPLWLKIAAGAAALPGFWAVLVFASVAALPSTIFLRFQLLVQGASLLPAGLLAWLVVRRQSTLLLALLIPFLLIVYLFVLNLMAPPLGQPP
jgi:hypothetical protein